MARTVQDAVAQTMGSLQLRVVELAVTIEQLQERISEMELQQQKSKSSKKAEP